MASDVILRVACDQYLVRFLETLYGPSPISFPKSSNWNMILDVFLEKPPMNYTDPLHDGPGVLSIRLPYFEVKDIRSYNYLSPMKEMILVKEIKKFFKITFRKEVTKYIMIRLERKDAIELFIAKYDLPMDCWDALEKDFQRYLKLGSKKRLFKNNLSSADESHVCPAIS